MTNLLMKSQVEGSDPSVEIVWSMVGQVHAKDEKDKLLGLTWATAFTRGLREGWLTAHPYDIMKKVTRHGRRELTKTTFHTLYPVSRSF
ncbi:hypothetical protein IWW34DRAFT_771304, partial [Fusarium oxysporum f. sp. albedinis]